MSFLFSTLKNNVCFLKAEVGMGVLAGCVYDFSKILKMRPTDFPAFSYKKSNWST
jgi:hypothetical protein